MSMTICYHFFHFQMVASSLQAAQHLAKTCEHTSRANLGILIGGNNNIHGLEPEEELRINSFLNANGYPDVSSLLPIVTEYRSVLRPLQKSVIGGNLYQREDTVLVAKGNGHVISKVKKFYLLSIADEYIPLVVCELFNFIRDKNDNSIIRHPLSDSVVVHSLNSIFCCHTKDLKRKLMLYRYQQGYVVIDPDRTLKLPTVVVPVFPKVGDMVLVKGEGSEVWQAEVQSVNNVAKSCKGCFFIKHAAWKTNGLWKKESSRRKLDNISFKSIVGLAKGKWHGQYWKEC